MKKLKVALTVAFVSTLTAALCACGGGKNKAEITAVSENQSVITLTDSDNAEALQQKLDEYKLNVTLKQNGEARGKPGTVPGSECEVVYKDNVALGQAGTYFIILKPTDTKEHRNPKAGHARVRVEIGHDWGSPDSDGVETCEKCKATHSGVELTKPETLKFGDFHEDTKVLTAGEGGSIIKEFGSVNVNGRQIDVSSFTVGRLTKGTAITVTGRAIADKFENIYYYFPIIGVADASAGQYTEGGTYQGTSVFVRNEGWTLVNGVGKENRMLAALAGGSSESMNYGSHINDTGDETKNRPAGYDGWKATYTDYAEAANGLPFASGDYRDWFVYTEGQIRQTPDYYPTEDNKTGLSLEMTWNYRLDGVMELTIANPVEETYLKAYVRVPDNDDGQGYYDAVIHGDYMTYTINSASYVTPLTLTSIEATADKEAKYLANTMLDFTDVTVQAKYEQNSGTQAATGFDVFGFVESADGKDGLTVGEEVKKGTLYDLSLYPLQENMSHFKVVLTVGPYSQEDVIAKADFVSVVQNSVDTVVAYPVAKDSAVFGEGVLNSYTLSINDAGKAVVALNGVGATLSEAQKTALGVSSGSNYFAFRIYANELGTKFNTTGTPAGAAYIAVGGDGAYADVVIVAGAEKTVTLTGLQTTDIIVDLNNVQGVKAASVVTASNLFFNKAGEITIDYSFAAGSLGSSVVLDLNTPSGTGTIRFNQVGTTRAGVTLKSVTELNETATTLKVVLETSANVVKSIFGKYTISLMDNNSGEILAQNIVRPSKSFSTDAGTAGTVLTEDGKTLAELDGNTLYISSIVSEKTNIAAGDVRVSGLMLNFNDGTQESVNILNLTGYYREYAGDFTTLDPDLVENGIVSSTGIYVDGTVGNDRDVDYIAVVMYAIDLTKLGQKESYLFDVVGERVGTYYEIKGGALTAKTYDAEIKDQLISEENTGSCYEGAYVAKAIKEGTETVFYAGAHVIGGEHKIVGSGNNHYCELCGAQVSIGVDFAKNAWFGSAWQDNKYIENGMVYEFTGTYKTFGAESKGMTVLLDGYNTDPTYTDSNKWYEGYRVAGDGYGHYVLNNGKTGDEKGWGELSDPYFDSDEFSGGKANFTNSLMTEEHPYNTLNGVIASDGSAVDTTQLSELMEGMSFRYTVSRENDVVTIRVRYYQEGRSFGSTPYIDYNFKVVCEENRAYKPVFTYFDSLCTIEDGKIDRYIGLLESNSVKQIEAETGVTATHTGATVTLTGMAPNFDQTTIEETELFEAFKAKGYTHVAGFEIEFTQALVSSTEVAVEGCADAATEFTDNNTKLRVLIPLKTDSAKTYKLNFTNLDASTAQCDLTLDFNNLAVSNYEVAITGAPTLTGGTFTATFSETLVATDKVTIAGETKAVSEITANNTVFGGLLKVTAKTDKAITFEQQAFDFTKKIENYELSLSNKDDVLLVNQAIEVGTTLTGTTIDGTTLVRASGSTLTLVLTQSITVGSTTSVTLNANMGGAKESVNAELLKNYNLEFTVKTDGSVTFTNRNALASATKAVYSFLDKGVVALTVDLSVLGIEKGAAAEPAYGFEATVADAAAAYLVNAARELTAINLDATAADVEIVGGTCTVDGLAAKAYTVEDSIAFWYGIAETKAGHTFPEQGGECTVCHDVTGWTVENVAVGKADNSTGWLGNNMPHGDEKAYNPDTTARFSAIVPGQKIVASGITTSSVVNSWNGLAILFYPGSAFSAYPTMHLRGDAWVNGLGNRTGGTDNTSHLTYAITAKVNDGDYNDAVYMTIAERAEATITWDWTDTSKVVITYELNGIAHEGHYVVTFTITPTGESFAASKYSIGIAPDSGSFRGTITATADKTVVSAENCNPVKHEHVYAPETDRCECGQLKPDHVHSYDATTELCKCGELNPAHQHEYVDGYCDKCSNTCKHTTLNEEICTVCGLKVRTATGFNNDLFTGYELAKGAAKTFVGTIESDMVENWHSLLFAVSQGWTMRSDNFEWLWGEADGGNGSVVSIVKNGVVIKNAAGETAEVDWWTTLKAVVKANSTWEVVFDWTGDTLVAKVTYTAHIGEFKDYTWSCSYALTMKEGLDKVNVQVGGENCKIGLKEVVPSADATPAE